MFQIIGVVSVFFICVSILSFCLKTHPDMRVPVIKNITVRTANGSMSWVLDKTQTNAHIAFFYIECVCNAWFTLEILVNYFKFLPKFKHFFFSFILEIFLIIYLRRIVIKIHRYDSYHLRADVNSLSHPLT